MVTFIDHSEAMELAAQSVRQQRIKKDISQKELAMRSGVSYAVIRKFEQTGKISLESFMKITLVLGMLPDIMNALEIKPLAYTSIDDVLNEKKSPPRKKARRHAKKI